MSLFLVLYYYLDLYQGWIMYMCIFKKLGLLDREVCFVFKVKVSELYYIYVKVLDYVYIIYCQVY